MQELKFLKERFQAALAQPDLPEGGIKRLAVLMLSLVAAKAVFRLMLTVLVVAGVVAWFTSRYEADNPDALRKIEEARLALDDAESRAEALQRNTAIARQEEAIQSALQTVVMALIARSVDATDPEQAFTDNVDELYEYGFRRNPELLYDLVRTRNANSDPSFVVTVSHREPGPRAFKWDVGQDAGPVAVGPSTSQAAPPTNIPLNAQQAQWAAEQAIQDKEFNIQYALGQVAFAQTKRWEATKTLTDDYAKLTSHYPAWQPDTQLIYEDMKLSQTPDGKPDFEVTVRHKERGPRAFSYRHSTRKIEPVD